MVDRLDPGSLDRLVGAVGSLDIRFDGIERRAAFAVYQQLVDGRPVSSGPIAEACGWDRPRAQRFVEELPHAERDDEGRVVGFGGLTLRETPHRIVIDGAVRHTWCAWDTLFLPVILDTNGVVASTCPQTGRQVELTVSAHGIGERDPEKTVLSFVEPDGDTLTDLRGSFCALIHFFVDGEAAQAWTRDVPGTFVLDLDDAFELGRRGMAG